MGMNILEESDKTDIVNMTAAKFPSFGGGRGRSNFNPIAEALKDRPPQFAAGVDIAEVVDFVLGELETYGIKT